jgi:two-component system chemotaxis sensor kinase CheA
LDAHELQAQLLATFLEEGFEGLDRLETGLLRLSQPGADVTADDTVNEIFRAAHSLKGAAGTFGLSGVTQVAHVMETVLDRIRARTLAPTHEVTAPLLEAVDELRAMLKGLADGHAPDARDAAALLARLEGFGVAASAPAAPAGVVFFDDEPSASEAASAPQAIAPEPARAPEPSARAASSTRADSSEPTLATIRISIDKVDLLMNMVGELVITQSMLGELDDDRPPTPERLGRLREGLSLLARNSRALQESVMRLRSLPISVAFNRFPRLIHDLGGKLGKQVELRVVGETTELDKTVLEKLGDPLVHLVRNSMDHGLETPAERRAAGKPETGTLTLAALHRGGDIVVEVSDDGRGLDCLRILERAVERGLVAEKAALCDREIRELIFAPGFSTAAAVTDLSGRGVGMDVVRRNIRSLGGEVTVDSTPGLGTKISLRLPLTLAIIDGQLVRVNGLPYVVPLLAIVESVEIEPRQVRRVVGGQHVYRLRDQLVPMLRLDALLGMTGADPNGAVQSGRLVVVDGDGQRVGLVVEELLGLQQVVVKSLETNYHRVPGISGATILGDGGVAFILDIAGLAQLGRRNGPVDAHAPAPLDRDTALPLLSV